jgi:hypothetical protein
VAGAQRAEPEPERGLEPAGVVLAMVRPEPERAVLAVGAPKDRQLGCVLFGPLHNGREAPAHHALDLVPLAEDVVAVRDRRQVEHGPDPVGLGLEEELPEGAFPMPAPDVDDRAAHRCERQVDDPLVRTEPPQLGVVGTT